MKIVTGLYLVTTSRLSDARDATRRHQNHHLRHHSSYYFTSIPGGNIDGRVKACKIVDQFTMKLFEVRRLLWIAVLMLNTARSLGFVPDGHCPQTSKPPTSCDVSPAATNGLSVTTSTQQRHRYNFLLQLSSESQAADGSSQSRSSKKNSELLQIVQLISASFVMAMLLVSWEDISMTHPMRQQQQQESYHWGSSTVRGMAFGQAQRLQLSDREPQSSQSILSYNEIMLKHRMEPIPKWQSLSLTDQDVQDSVSTVQKSLLKLNECKSLAKDYDWDGLSIAVRHPLLHEELVQACTMLKSADKFLSSDARDEVGFQWASCAWRHCGALADAQEAIEELDHLIGILEPFECLFCLDVVERSLYDILAVTKPYQDSSIEIPVYQPLHRMSDVGEDGIDQFEAEYLEALEFLKHSDDE
jgi:hypothetical protein